MSGMLRPLASLLVSALVAAPFLASPQADGDFEQGVDLMRRGRDAEALAAFQRVLATEHSNEEAYELWKNTDHKVWLDMLSKHGEWELVARRFMELSSLGRAERTRDPKAIRALLPRLDSPDVVEYRKALRELASAHGEYAVPYMLGALADQVHDDRRVRTMQALSEMGDDVVLPLVEALQASDAFLRRNVALTLGYIGDHRAAPALAAHAAGDADPGVRAAATEALGRCGGGEALAGYLALGEAYHLRKTDVLRPYQYSDVIWSWDGTGLVATDVPKYLYNEELAKGEYYAALDLQPGSAAALSGLARVLVSEQARIAQHGDEDDLADRLEEAQLALLAAGPAALDRGLVDALQQNDEIAALGLCRALQETPSAPTAGLDRALGHPASAALRSEAAVALGNAAYRSGHPAGAEVVATLAEAAGREIARIGLVIDGDGARAHALAGALEGAGFSVGQQGGGASGLAAIYHLPGADLILLADRLPDMTADRVLAEIKKNPTTAETPVVLISSDPEQAADMFGDRVAAAIASADDIDQAVAAAGEDLGRERELANELAARAAQTLARLAFTGTDVGSATDVLAGTLAGRPDAVTMPAVHALGQAGQARHVAALAAVLGDDGRTEELRVSAAHALAMIFGRAPQAGGDAVAILRDVLDSGASLDLRRAVAQALGQLDLGPELRTELLHAVRGNLGNA